jgi:hypothetical protein
MSDESRRGSDNTAIVALMVALPLIYAFSVGPVIFVMEKFHASSSVRGAVETFYAPVLWLYDNTVLKQPLEATSSGGKSWPTNELERRCSTGSG